jgi:hypothetical protein
MRELTKELLKEEAKKYFPDIQCTVNIGPNEKFLIKGILTVLPEYSEWIKEHRGKIPSYPEEESTVWKMQDYISIMLGLAEHLIENRYSQKAVLSMLPQGLSLRVLKRLNE